MLKKRLKQLNAWLHLWLGLISGIVVVILSITGCILVFEHEIKSLNAPWLMAEKPAGGILLPPSKLHKSVSQALPGKEIHSIWYHGENKTVQFSVDSDSLIYVNPYTAEVVAMVHHEDFFEFIDEGHRRLWLPDAIGKQVVGWSTFIFFLLLITGIVLWWPKKWNKAGRNQSFKIKWKARFKRVNYDLHNVLGFYSLVVALIFAITGLIMSFSWFNKGVYWLSGGNVNQKFEQSVSDTTVHKQVASIQAIDKIWKKATSELAEYNRDEVIISFPEQASDAIYVCVDMINGAWRDIYLDQHTLQPLPGSQTKLKDAAISTWLRRSNYGLHVGAFAGLTTKIIYFLASLIAASLPITGFYIWWGKQRKVKSKSKTFSIQ